MMNKVRATLTAILLLISVPSYGQLDEMYAKLQQSDKPVLTNQLEVQIGYYLHNNTNTDNLALIEKATHQLAAGKYSNALLALDDLIERAPLYTEGWFRRAGVYYMLAKYNSSLEDLDKTLEIEPRHLGALQGQALALMALNSPSLALEVYEKIIALSPLNHAANSALKELETSLLETSTQH